MDEGNQLRKFADAVEADASARTLTREGYLVAPAVLARVGVFQYQARELGLGDSTELISVYRSRDALEKSLDSFAEQTITLDHKWTTAVNWRSNAIGDVADVEMRGNEMVGTLIVRDATAIRAIQDGAKTQLSNGYSANVERRSGTYQGQAYDYEQTNFVGNHIAVVGAARCGSECRIQDEDIQRGLFMPTQRSFDGLTVQMENEQSAQVFDRMLRALDETKQELADLKAEAPKVYVGDKALTGEEVKQMFDCQCQEIAKLKAEKLTDDQIAKLIAERSNAITTARELMPEIKIGDADTPAAIIIQALDYVRPKEDDAKRLIDAAFGPGAKLQDVQADRLVDQFPTIATGIKIARERRKTQTSRSQLAGIVDATEPKLEKDARQAAIERLQDAWKAPSKEVN